MKKLFITVLLILFCATAYAGSAFDAKKKVIAAKNAAAGCAASYVQKITTENATLNSASDFDATTDWVDNGTGLDSVSTGTPALGTYHLYGVADASAEYFGNNVLSNYSLSDGTFYKVSFQYKHDGTGGGGYWYCGFGASLGNQVYPKLTFDETVTTYQTYTEYFIMVSGGSFAADSDYFSCEEGNAGNDGGMYLDNFSVSEPTLCLGSELYTGSDALNPSSDSDANPFTSFVAQAPDTNESTSAGTPYNGTYHIHIETDAEAGAGAYLDLSSYMSNATKYQISLWVKHIGSGGLWRFALDDVGAYVNPPTKELQSYDTNESAWREMRTVITYSSLYRYLNVYEFDGTNDGGLYIDMLSIKEVTAE